MSRKVRVYGFEKSAYSYSVIADERYKTKPPVQIDWGRRQKNRFSSGLVTYGEGVIISIRRAN